MILLSTFSISFGMMLLTAAIIAAWLFRSVDAPLLAKVIIVVLIVFLACFTPYQVGHLLGYPFQTDSRNLPDEAELIAFAPVGVDEKMIDLWLKEESLPPRSYEVILDDKLKKVLRDAQGRQTDGHRVELKRGNHHTGQRDGQFSDAIGSEYEIDDSFFSLPNKDGNR